MKQLKSSRFYEFFLRTVSGIFVVSLLLGLFACASQKPEKSGFLSDYGNLVPSSKYEGLYVYRSEENILNQYSKFYIDHVIAFLSKKGRERGIDATEINKLTEYFRNELIKAIQDKYELVGFGQRQAGTLHIKVAITDLEPRGVASGGSPGKSNINLGGASAEFEFVDYQTGAVVLTGLISGKGSRPDDMKTWENTQDVLRKWAGMLRKSLDEDRDK